jgi:hypothetical protein
MSWSRLLCITTLALCSFLSLVVEFALAEDKTVKVEKEWKGGSGEKKDNEAWKQAPPDMVIADSKAWEKLWKAWHFEKELPKVDFEKDLILVVACEGPNSIRIDKLTLSEKGNLTFDWSHSGKGGARVQVPDPARQSQRHQDRVRQGNAERLAAWSVS